MAQYLSPILSACYVFPFLAALFTLPYIIRQYNKYGALLMLRVGIIYSFIFYLMTSYFMTILPLPPVDSVTEQSATVLLIPFDAVKRAIQASNFSLYEPSTYIPFLTCSDALQIYFNILLLLPFGVYLRYYFNRKWYQVLLLSFFYSLFFELTQLSGLYGIYPYPYRYFEVDDLICNTLGGLIGFFITPALLFFLPDKKRLDEMSYKKGQHISIYRRFLAYFIDVTIISLIFTISSIFFLQSNFNARYITFLFYITQFILFTMIEIISHGRTAGKRLVNIKLSQNASCDSQNSIKRPHAWQYVIRNFLLYIIYLPGPYYIYELMILSQKTDTPMYYLIIAAIIFILIILSYISINIFICFIKRKPQYIYDKLCNLTTISTVKLK